MGHPHEDLAAHIRLLLADIPATEEVAVTTNWPSTASGPGVNVRPERRTHIPVCDVEWALAVDVFVPLTGDQTFVHDLVEAINSQPLKGYVVGDTSYGQRSIGGADLLFVTTEVLHRR